jgi:hypothetical protein
LTTTIAPTTSLRSWILIVAIIVVRFMVDQCPFLFETLTQVNNNTFLSINTSTCALLPPPTYMCFFLFEQFIG